MGAIMTDKDYRNFIEVRILLCLYRKQCMKKTQLILALIVLVSTLAGCTGAATVPMVAAGAAAAHSFPADEGQTNQPTVVPTNAPSGSTVINPLTGLPFEDPSMLGLSPVLISVSNFPVSVRPVSGLSFAPHVFEITIGEGMTRFLAIYYGDYGPEDQMDVKLGSIRSGRLPYEQLRTMYDGTIVMAGAAPDVDSQLGATVFRETIDFNGILDLAEDRTARKGAPSFEPIVADAAIQPGGVAGSSLYIRWSLLDKVRWTYDAGSGKYLREQDNADGKETMTSAVDKLTGEQLAFDNVVILGVEHNYLNDTKIEMAFEYIDKAPAIFFRDGKAYQIFWSSTAPLGPLKFYNADGTPFPYKPGNTFYEVVHTVNEATQKEDGSWYVKFLNP